MIINDPAAVAWLEAEYDQTAAILTERTRLHAYWASETAQASARVLSAALDRRMGGGIRRKMFELIDDDDGCQTYSWAPSDVLRIHPLPRRERALT